jgi:hypothetical protein
MPTSSQVNCYFCNSSPDEGARLVAGPGGVFICERCVAKGFATLAGVAARLSEGDAVASGAVIFCSFCGKTAQEIALTGHGKHDICSECLVKSAEIMLGKVTPRTTSRKWP